MTDTQAAHLTQPATDADPPATDQVRPSSATLPEALAAAEADHADAWTAWSRDPGSPELLDAYLAARTHAQTLRRHLNTWVQLQGPGPTTITPVIEWWTT